MDLVAILIMWHNPVALSFIPPSYGGSTWNLASIGIGVFKEKNFENV